MTEPELRALAARDAEQKRVETMLRDLASLGSECCAIFSSEAATAVALIDAEREKVRVLREALWKAAVRLEILTGRMRGCHAETGRHELMDEAEMFCAEARAALNGWCPPNTDRALATTETKP